MELAHSLIGPIRKKLTRYSVIQFQNWPTPKNWHTPKINPLQNWSTPEFTHDGINPLRRLDFAGNPPELAHSGVIQNPESARSGNGPALESTQSETWARSGIELLRNSSEIEQIRNYITLESFLNWPTPKIDPPRKLTRSEKFTHSGIGPPRYSSEIDPIRNWYI